MQVLAFLDHFGIADDDPRVNPWGGAIAIGHPLASLRRPADDPARAAVRGAPRGAVRPDRDVHRHRHGRHGHLGEPALGRGRQVSRARLRNEVVTHAHVRFVDRARPRRPAALITLDNGQTTPGRPRFGPGGLRRLDAALDEPRWPAPGVDRGHRQAVHLRRRRRPHRRPAGHRRASRRVGDRPARPPGVRRLKRLDGADVRVRQRRGDGRRPGARAALPLPDDVRRAPPRWRCPRCSSAWSRAGAARSCCRT